MDKKEVVPESKSIQNITTFARKILTLMILIFVIVGIANVIVLMIWATSMTVHG